ncbi:MAG: hypothetical protein H6940_04855 [Burkholderiales bacterium]|nr:hypothetical protein [Burkholderiales bacterium]MDR4515553.1 hypothetical protein [Nitrosomonas sp.]
MTERRLSDLLILANHSGRLRRRLVTPARLNVRLFQLLILGSLTSGLLLH